MKPLAVTPTKSITDALAPDEARVFRDLVRVVQQRTDRETLEICDEAGEVFGFLVLLQCHAPPAEAADAPEFLEELGRRMQSPEPAVPVEEFLEHLKRDEWTE